jgi:hypothetical protein
MARRRLAKMDMMPDEAREDIVWAYGELNAGRREQQEILAELNERLADKGLEPVSRSAFSRKAMKLSKWAEKLETRRYVYSGIAKSLTPDVISQSDIVLGEFLKALLDDLADGDGLDTKGAMELAKAYKEIIVGQRHSIELRSKSEKADAERRTTAEKAANDKLGQAVKSVAGELGLSQETVDALNRKIAQIAVKRQVVA